MGRSGDLFTPAIKSSSFISLTRDPNDSRDNHQRLVLRAEVETPVGPTHFFNTHFSLSRNARSRNVREITPFVGRHTGQLPHVLVGDFNETADEDPIQYLTNEGGFLDAWPQIHPDDPGWTYSTANLYVNEKRETEAAEGRRIDYIFVHPQVGSRGQSLSCRIVADRSAEDGHFPSDHFGVIVDINLEES